MYAEQLSGILFIMVAITAACHVPHAVSAMSVRVRQRLATLASRRPLTARAAYGLVMGASMTFIMSHVVLYLFEGIGRMTGTHA